MSMRTLAIVGVAFVVLLSGVAVAAIGGIGGGDGGAVAAQTADTSDNATIQVTSSAELSATPDVATVRFAVTATADTADTARQQVANNASSVRTALREMGVADDDVRTAYYDISAVHGEERETIEGYRAVHAYEVAVDADSDDLGNQTGAIVDTVVQNGADRIDSIAFGLAEETRSELRQEALERAMTSADRDAATLAAASDLTIVGVQSISTTDSGVRPAEVAFREADAAGGTAIEPGQVTIRATVSVTYETE